MYGRSAARPARGAPSRVPGPQQKPPQRQPASRRALPQASLSWSRSCRTRLTPWPPPSSRRLTQVWGLGIPGHATWGDRAQVIASHMNRTGLTPRLFAGGWPTDLKARDGASCSRKCAFRITMPVVGVLSRRRVLGRGSGVRAPGSARRVGPALRMVERLIGVAERRLVVAREDVGAVDSAVASLAQRTEGSGEFTAFAPSSQRIRHNLDEVVAESRWGSSRRVTEAAVDRRMKSVVISSV